MGGRHCANLQPEQKLQIRGNPKHRFSSLRESRLLLKRLDSWQSTKDFCHIER